MSGNPKTAGPVTIPPPTHGMETTNPFVDANSGTCHLLRNFIPYNASIKRRGVSFVNQTLFSGGLTCLWWSPFSSTAVYSDGTIRDINTGTSSYSSGLTHYPINSFTFRNVTFLMHKGDTPAKLSAAFPYTASYATSNIKGGCSYRSRAYFFTDYIISYGDINALAGALSDFDISALMQDIPGDVIIGIQPYSGNSGLSQDSLFSIFTAGGMVLLYAGSYPASTDWRLVGKFFMSQPLSQQSIITIDGDVVIATVNYLYSVSELLAQGAAGVKQNATSNPIKNLWLSLSQPAFNAAGRPIPFVVYCQPLDAIIVGMKYAVDVFGGDISDPNDTTCRVQLVFFRQQQAWAIWDVASMTYPAYSNSFSLVSWLHRDGLRSIYLDFSTAPSNFAKYGQDVNSLDSSTKVYYKAEWRAGYLGNNIVNQIANRNTAMISSSNASYIKDMGFYGELTDFFVAALTSRPTYSFDTVSAPSQVIKSSETVDIGVMPYNFNYVASNATLVAKEIAPFLVIANDSTHDGPAGAGSAATADEEIYGMIINIEQTGGSI